MLKARLPLTLRVRCTCNAKDRSDYNKASLLTLHVQREAEVVVLFHATGSTISHMLDGANYIAPLHVSSGSPKYRETDLMHRKKKCMHEQHTDSIAINIQAQ